MVRVDLFIAWLPLLLVDEITNNDARNWCPTMILPRVLVRRLPVAAWALRPARSPKTGQARNSLYTLPSEPPPGRKPIHEAREPKTSPCAHTPRAYARVA